MQRFSERGSNRYVEFWIHWRRGHAASPAR